MTGLMSLTEKLSAVAGERLGLKAGLSSPKIEALLRTMPEEERETWCRDVARGDAASDPYRRFVEALLVHETYFFRHPDQLRHLAEDVVPRLVKARLDAGDGGDLSVWCAGCSSGEEVYTVALLLQTALSRLPGVNGRRATVLGTDLSWQAIHQARRGDYASHPGLNSFRDVPADARQHFPAIFGEARADGAVWSAGPELRRATSFLEHNLVTDPPPRTGFDLILCRNTLIYFDENATRRALRTLEAALRPGGVLLLGPAESPAEDSRLVLTCAAQAVFWTKPA